MKMGPEGIYKLKQRPHVVAFATKFTRFSGAKENVPKDDSTKGDLTPFGNFLP